jgi:ABC-2 type transport system ATP-binding protein
MRMMVTLEQPDAGWCRIAGCDVVQHPAEARRHIGWMPDSFGTYDYMTVFEYLDFYARAFGFTGAARRARVQEVMEFTDLHPLAARPMNKLSKGMNQRLCLGRTLLHDPPVLVLDEPAAGLDPKARMEFKHLVRLLAEDGKTLFISSHILSELEEMCDSLLFIDQGRIMHHGSAEKLKQEQDGSLVVAVEAPADPGSIARWCQLNENVEVLETTRRGARIRLLDATEEDLARLLRRMISDGLPVTEFRREQLRLEDAFVNLLRDAAAARPPPLPPPLPGGGA